MKKISITSFLPFALLFFIVVVPVFVQAQPTGGGNAGSGGGNAGTGGGTQAPVLVNFEIPNPFSNKGDLFDLMLYIEDKIILPIGGILCVLAFIYSGFMYVMAQGNSTKITDANRALLYSAIGTAVLLGSKVIASVIEGTVNQLK